MVESDSRSKKTTLAVCDSDHNRSFAFHGNITGDEHCTHVQDAMRDAVHVPEPVVNSNL